ncbi:hypothetical protein [Streptomyces poriticola]|uniref:hypothetical protein n=1 Tax=Streptomyces poriticola TaxID=3120506 RepID=UPI002FCE6290
MADRGPLRAARAAAFSLVCVLLAALGHGVAGGHPPSPLLLAVGGAAVAVTAGRLAGRERTLTQLGVAVTLAQGALHLLFAFAGPGHPAASPAAHHGGAAGHAHAAGHHAGRTAAGASEGGVASSGTLLDSAHLDPLMVLAHLVAGVGAAWWLRQGEALVWRLCRLLGAPVSAALHALELLRRGARNRPDGSRPRLPRRCGADTAVPCRTRTLEHTLARRGPPLPFTP